jgi:hypothetical protein
MAMHDRLDQVQDEAWQRHDWLAVTDAKAPIDTTSYYQSEMVTGTHALRCLFTEDNASPNPVFDTWFFIEHLDISDITANVTVTLSSNITALLNFEPGTRRPADHADIDGALDSNTHLHNQLMHLFQRSGFQLINVTNIALQLKVRCSI